jgi:uncharacterized protein YkwD
MSTSRITRRLPRRWPAGWVAPAIFLMAVVQGCSSSESPTSPGEALTASEVELQLLQLANLERSSEEVNPRLGSDSALSEIARSHSFAMRDQGFFGHEGPEGRTLRQRLDAAGVQYSRAAENIAQVTNSTDPAAFAHELLMDSERHRANILDPRFSHVGIGVSRSGDTFWITQIFVKP